MKRIVADVELAQRVVAVELVQSWREPVIQFEAESGEAQESRFVGSVGAIAAKKANALGTLRSTSRIEGEALITIAEAIAEDV